MSQKLVKALNGFSNYWEVQEGAANGQVNRKCKDSFSVFGTGGVVNICCNKM